MKRIFLLLTIVILISSGLNIFALDADVVAYYPFNGNANDESGNGINGTVHGATLTTDRFGRADHAYYFNGTDNYISVPDNNNLNIGTGESFSVSYWIKHDDVLNKGKYIISKYKGSFGEPSYAFGTGTDGDAYSWFEQTPNNGIENRGQIELNDGEWHNIIVIFKSGESISIYVDGVLDVSNPTTYTGSIINSLDLTIGCGANLAQFYQGAIDDIRFYKKALTEKEINELAHLIAYYPFDENANDKSEYGNDGEVFGAVLTTDRHGMEEKAYYFDGDNDYILCDSEVGPFGNDSRTITFWAKTDVVPNSGEQQNTVLSYGGNIYDGGSRFEVLINPKCRGVGVDLSSKYKTWGFDNSDDLWHHYAVVFDNSISDNLSDLKIYADGQILTSVCNDNGGNIAINTLDEQKLNIGRLFYSGQPRYFRGSIDELRIYDKALSEQEINDLYDSDTPTVIRKEKKNVKNHLYIYNGVLNSKSSMFLYDISIINITGQTVYHNVKTNLPLDVSFLKKGIYVVRTVDMQGNISNTKIFKR